MKLRHVLVAHRGGARYYNLDLKAEQLRLLEEMTFPKGKLKPSELDADRPGRTRGKFKSPAPMGDNHDSSDTEETRNAKTLAEFVSKERLENADTQILVSAGPQMLGKIRAAFERQSKNEGVVWVSKNLEKNSDAQILTVVREAVVV